MFPFDVLSWLIRGRYKITPPVLADGADGELQLTAQGAVKVAIVEGGGGGGEAPTTLHSASGALAKLGTIKASPGRLYQLDVINTASALQFLLIFDKAALPATNDVPVAAIPVPANNGFASKTIVGGLPCAAGIAWGMSTSPTSYQAVSANTAWVEGSFT